MQILRRLFLIFSLEFKFPSPAYVNWVILKSKDLFEKKNNKNIKKYNPPIHWEEDLQRISVGSRYFIFSKIEKPVPVKPDSDSKSALTKFIFKLER